LLRWHRTFAVRRSEVTLAISSWTPRQEVSQQEEHIIQRMKRTGKLFAFPRRYRHEIFDEAFQAELASMYRDTRAENEPVSPRLMAMATHCRRATLKPPMLPWWN